MSRRDAITRWRWLGKTGPGRLRSSFESPFKPIRSSRRRIWIWRSCWPIVGTSRKPQSICAWRRTALIRRSARRPLICCGRSGSEACDTMCPLPGSRSQAMMKSVLRCGALVVLLSSLVAFQPGGASHLADPFAAGWMVADTNGDGVVDFVPGKIVVPDQPTAAQNAAAADLAARVGFATTGFTPPVVIRAAEDRGGGPRIFIGRAAPVELESQEGGIFAADGNLIVAGHDDAGLLAAAEAFAARAPYIWRVPGPRLSALAGLGQLTGVTYLKGKAGINRAFFSGAVANLDSVLSGAQFAMVHQIVSSGGSATNPKPLPDAPPIQLGAPQNAAHAGSAGSRRTSLCTGGRSRRGDGESGGADGNGDHRNHAAAGDACRCGRGARCADEIGGAGVVPSRARGGRQGPVGCGAGGRG